MKKRILTVLAVLMVSGGIALAQGAGQEGEVVCFEKQNNLFFKLQLSQDGSAHLLNHGGHTVLQGSYELGVVGPGTRTSGMTTFEIHLDQANPDSSLYQGMNMNLLGNEDGPQFGSGVLKTDFSSFKKQLVFSCASFQ